MSNSMRHAGLSLATLALVASMITTPMRAEAADATLGGDILSAYVWRGITFNDEGVFQPSLDVSNENGFGVNVWGNLDLGDYNGAVDSGEFSEVDLTLSYAIPVEGYDVSVGFIQYLFPQAGADTNTREIYLSTGFSPMENTSLGADIYYDIDAFDGWYGTLYTGYDIPVNEEFSLSLGASIGIADGGFARKVSGGTEGGLHDWNVSLSGAYALTESVELGAIVAYTDSANTDVLPNQDADVYGGGSVYWSF